MPEFDNNPTSDYVVFDPGVFEWGFIVMDIIPDFTRIIVSREHRKVEAGQAVIIECQIEDVMTTPGQRFPFNPDTTPQVKLYKPDGTLYQDWTNMNFSGVTGYYNYQKQTATNADKGKYSGQFKAVNGTMTGQTEIMELFEVS
jgi:hypothetical protein